MSSYHTMKRQSDWTETILSSEHSGLWCFSKSSSILGPSPHTLTRLTQVQSPPCPVTQGHRTKHEALGHSSWATAVRGGGRLRCSQQVLSTHWGAQHVAETKQLFLPMPWRNAPIIFFKFSTAGFHTIAWTTRPEVAGSWTALELCIF